jgi:hypothetical protein
MHPEIMNHLYQPTPIYPPHLNRRRVEHDANRRAKRPGGEGVCEFGTNDTRVAMWPGNLAPDHADLGATDFLLAAIDIGDLLSEVEVGSVGVVDALDLDKARLGVSRVPAALVAEVATLDV